LEELHDAIAIEPGEGALDDDSRLSSPQDILSLRGSLLNISGQSSVRLAYLSVKGYVLSSEIRKDDDLSFFAPDPERANHALAADCLTSLSFEGLDSGPHDIIDGYLQRLED
jgi:hypothetical protein